MSGPLDETTFVADTLLALPVRVEDRDGILLFFSHGATDAPAIVYLAPDAAALTETAAVLAEAFARAGAGRGDQL